jgi:ABC-type transport system involved in cytochrome c biogenesis permease subunit
LLAFFVAATAVTLRQYLRLRDRKLLALLALFAFLGLAHSRGEWDPWGRMFHFAAGASGLVLLLALSPRHTVRTR